MKKIREWWYRFQATHCPVENEKYTRVGMGEYLAGRGIGNEIQDTKDEPKMVEGEALVILDRKLSNIKTK